MAKLTYLMITSLDGYVTDRTGGFDWSEPSEEVHQFVNDLERTTGAMIYGRRMYETMAVWETLGDEPDSPEVMRDYAEVWKAHEKVVVSSTLHDVSTPRTELLRSFDPGAVRQMVDAADRDVTISGPTLAAHALRAGIVDEVGLVINPVVIGSGGLSVLPGDVELHLTLLEERRFDNGVVYVRYRVDGSKAL